MTEVPTEGRAGVAPAELGTGVLAGTDRSIAGRGRTGPGPELRPLARAGASLDLRVYAVAALAIVYVLAWWAFAAPVPAPAASPRRAEAPAPAVVPAPAAPVTAWYEDLPPSLRPAVTLPAGWRLASPAAGRPGIAVRTVPAYAPASPSYPVARPVRVLSRRPGRVRTRSS